jgi:hypothetical protein
MLRSSFDSKEDHECVDVLAIANFPTIAIFMAQIPDQDLKKEKEQESRQKHTSCESLFTCSLSCCCELFCRWYTYAGAVACHHSQSTSC